ncbi:MAG: hypothetical protein H8E25_01005 [Planctomycetes bacterium]|nr:hypothetical protein [Planctomycetota bacterium]
MRNLVNTFLISALMLGFASCAGGEKPGDVAETKVLSEVCCGGNCDAPAGTCCNDDGTCGGSHIKLPLAKNQ